MSIRFEGALSASDSPPSRMPSISFTAPSTALMASLMAFR